MLSAAFNVLIKLKGRSMVIYEGTYPVAPDTATLLVAKSNYFANKETGAASITSRQREYVVSHGAVTAILVRPPRKGDKLRDLTSGSTWVIADVDELIGLGGTTLGYRLAVN